MCAIAGFFDATLMVEEASQIVSNMLSSMFHRGPDSAGTHYDMPLALGQNRLSIIDLSDEANQPFVYDHFVVVHNGGIYNNNELREELKSLGLLFKTKSDTEVIAAAYKAWGEDCVNRFIGMWAFAIWDTNRKVLFCSRDRFGIKPFNYIFSGGRFYFASEYRALKLTPLFTSKLNCHQIALGLNLGWLSYNDETYYADIKSIPAGCNLVFSNGQITVKRYWDINLTRKINLTEKGAAERFLELFTNSLNLHIRSDVKIGACLSGGLDSSSIVSLVAQLFSGKKVEAYTIYYDGEDEVDECPWAEKVSGKYNNVEWYTYKPGDDVNLEAFYKTQEAIELPLTGSSPVSQQYLMRLVASRGTKILLDGQGADEYLGGYMHSFDRLVWPKVSQFKFRQLIRQLIFHKKHHQLSTTGILMILAKGLAMSFMDEHMYFETAFSKKFPNILTTPCSLPKFDMRERKFADSFDNYLYHQLFTANLPTLLHYVDRNSMALSVESRMPFLDHRLVEFCFELETDHKINIGETKLILRNSMKGILPDEIRNRHDKKGFVTPGENKWLRGPLRHLLEVDFSDYSFIDGAKAVAEIGKYKAGKGNAALTWRLVALNHWLKEQ